MRNKNEDLEILQIGVNSIREKVGERL